MNCQFEEHIFLYDEISLEQRAELKSHMETCEECRQAWEVFNRARAAAITWKSDTPLPFHSAALTNAILSRTAYSPAKHTSASSRWTDFVYSKWLRYGLSGLCALLLLAFIDEPEPKALPTINPLSMSGEPTVNLNSNNFIKANRNETKPAAQFSLSKCLTQLDCNSFIESKKKQYYEHN